MRTGVLTVLVAGLVALCGTGVVLVDRAFTADDGDSTAEDLAQQHAEQLNTRLGYRNRPRDAESIAATEVTAAAAYPGAHRSPEMAEVAVLAWSGRVYSSEKATIDVRFTVTVSAASGYFGPSHTAGSATRCYRYTLQYYRSTEYREIRCPSITELPVPSASPVLRLPGDAADRLAAALRAAGPETLADRVRAAFPQEGFRIDTGTAGGTLVAAVGVPSERDCIVMIRTPGGATRQVAFDREQLEPGESGCGTALYTHPVR
jgi:hypothetical protein